MTTTAPAPTRAPARRGNPWRPSLHGVGLVTRIELLRRRPTAKGYIVYGLVLAAILGLGILVAVVSGDEMTSMPMELVIILVLGAGMLIAPSLSATSINGDSTEGVLAPLQMTHLTAGDLAFGKLLASWLVSFIVLATTTPFLVYAYLRSGWHWHELAIVLGAVLLVVLTATAVGLAWSAIAARAVASVSLAHLTTGFLLLGTLVLFAFTMPLVSEDVDVTQRYPDWEAATEEDWNDPNFDESQLPCIEETWQTTITHTDRTAWLLLINPVVMIGEVSPIVDPQTYEEDGRAAPGLFAYMHQSVSAARIGPDDVNGPIVEDYCSRSDEGLNQWEEREQEQANYPPYPWLGLAAQVVLLVGSMTLVVRRLRVPYKTLRTGTRVA